MKRSLSFLLLAFFMIIGTGAHAQTGTGQDAHILTRFYLSRGGYRIPESWEISRNEGGYTIRENEEAPRPFDMELAEEVLRILQENDVDRWDGFHESDPNVLDGESFCLEMEYADGTLVSASGSNCFPDHYHAVTEAIDVILHKDKMDFISGVYRCENEDDGEALIIMLDADGTYTFSKNHPLNCVGKGIWDVYSDAVYMTEGGESGFDPSLYFGYDGEGLTYIAAASDVLPYAMMSDGARFVRAKENEDG